MEQRLCEWPAGTEGAPRAITRLEGQIEEQVMNRVTVTMLFCKSMSFLKGNVFLYGAY